MDVNVWKSVRNFVKEMRRNGKSNSEMLDAGREQESEEFVDALKDQLESDHRGLLMRELGEAMTDAGEKTDRKKKANPKLRKEIVKLISDGLAVEQIVQELGCREWNVYWVLGDYKLDEAIISTHDANPDLTHDEIASRLGADWGTVSFTLRQRRPDDRVPLWRTSKG